MKSILRSVFILLVAFSLNNSLMSMPGYSDMQTIFDQVALDRHEDHLQKPELMECPICNEFVRNLVPLPCGHLVCDDCLPQLERCPTCRGILGADPRLLNREEMRQGRIRRLGIVRVEMEELRAQMNELSAKLERLEGREQELIAEIDLVVPEHEPAILSGRLIQRIERYVVGSPYTPVDVGGQCNQLNIFYNNRLNPFVLSFNTYWIVHYEVIDIGGKELFVCLLKDYKKRNYAIVFFDPQTGRRSSMKEYVTDKFYDRARYIRVPMFHFINTNMEEYSLIRINVADDQGEEKIFLRFINNADGGIASKVLMLFIDVMRLFR